MKKSILIGVLCAFWGLTVHAQRTCATMDALDQDIREDSSLLLQIRDIEIHTQNYIFKTGQRAVDGIITIPVVVHIVYNTDEENIPDEQVYSQIDVLNEDFRRLNSDADDSWPQASDSEVEFCLATTDPDGVPFCGITRTYTDETGFSYSGNPVKSSSSGGVDAWPCQDYLNIWVCDLESTLLGYAQFPGGSCATDGVVIDFYNFGDIGDLHPDFNLGRTGTHEVGHWLNLRHIWGDGNCNKDDYVSDTPKSDAANYNCPLTHSSCGSLDMVANYMDYSDDNCMNLFTEGQKDRMRALFDEGGFRESLLDSYACDTGPPCTVVTLSIDFDNYPEDISWEFLNSDLEIVSSGGNYSNNLQSVTERFCAVNGDYTFNIYDSYGDGLCCAEGTGAYEIAIPGQVLVESDGQFGSGETHDFTIDNQVYTFTFIGPGNDWNEESNWLEGSPPFDCFRGDIFIQSDCLTNGVDPYNDGVRIYVENGASLMVN